MTLPLRHHGRFDVGPSSVGDGVVAPRGPIVVRRLAARTTHGQRSHLRTADYRNVFGWSVDERDDGAFLRMGNGVAGVAMQAKRALPVIEFLRRYSSCGPVFSLKQENLNYEDVPWVFLSDPNGVVVSQAELPRDIRLLNCPALVPLPDEHSPLAQWVVRPQIGQRWLPTLSMIVAACRKTAR